MSEPNGGVKVSDLAVSFIRTWVPYAMSSLLATLAVKFAIVVPEGISAMAMVWITAGLAAAYYAAARWLERRSGPSGLRPFARLLGRWMLGGVIRQPTYGTPVGVVRRSST